MNANGRSKGSVLLTRKGSTQDAIAQRLDVSSSVVAHWQLGTRKPGMPNRKLLLETYGIPIESWDEEPHTVAIDSAPASKGVAMTVVARAEALERAADSLMAFVTEDESCTPHEKAKVINSLAHTLNNLRRLKGENAAEAKVVQHPKWLDLRAAVISALSAHPVARAAVVRALESLETDTV